MTTLTCQWCGRNFDRTTSRGPVPRYCSNSHRQQAYHARRIAEAVEAALRARGGIDMGAPGREGATAE